MEMKSWLRTNASAFSLVGSLGMLKRLRTSILSVRETRRARRLPPEDVRLSVLLSRLSGREMARRQDRSARRGAARSWRGCLPLP